MHRVLDKHGRTLASGAVSSEADLLRQIPDLRQVDFSQLDLRHSDLTGLDFRNIDLSQTPLDGAKIDGKFVRFDWYNVILQDNMIMLGCVWITPSFLITASAEDFGELNVNHGSRGSLRTVQWIRRNKDKILEIIYE